jgi:hypothetical protein
MTGHSRLFATFALVMALAITGCGGETLEGSGERLGDAAEGVDLDAALPERDSGDTAAEPEPEPAPESDVVDAPVESGESDGGLSTEGWILAAILGVVILGGLISFASGSKRRSNSQAEVNSALNSRVGSVVGSSRWLHDQGSVEVLQTTDRDQLRSVWNNVRDRIVSLEADAAGTAGMASRTSPEINRDVGRVGRSLSELRSALESNVALRLNDDGTTDISLVEQSARLVDERRRQLDEATSVLSSDWL